MQQLCEVDKQSCKGSYVAAVLVLGAHICTATMWEGRSIGSSYVRNSYVGQAAVLGALYVYNCFVAVICFFLQCNDSTHWLQHWYPTSVQQLCKV